MAAILLSGEFPSFFSRGTIWAMEWVEAGWGTKWTGRRVLLAVALCLIASCSPKKEALRPPPPRMEDVQLRLAANREFVGVQFRMIGADGFNPEVTEIYLVDESTGEKFSVVRLQRI